MSCSSCLFQRFTIPLYGRATWSMGDWGSFQQFVAFTEEDVVEGAYFRAVLALRKGDLVQCTRYCQNHSR